MERRGLLRRAALLLLLALPAEASARRGRRRITLAGADAPAPGRLGPDGCVSLSRSAEGTCIISTDCSANTSDTEFAFVCFNPGSAVPHALHSFGRGGFAPREAFDTGVRCGSCASVEYALSADGPLLKGALAAPSDQPSLPYEEPLGSDVAGNASTGALGAAARRVQTAFYGPSSCVATFLSPRGTCMIETKCSSVPGLADFTVGLTCLDETGDYTRYLFGKGSFQPEEVFDSTLRCQACLGVGDEPVQQLRSMVPKLLVQDVASLRDEVRTLRREVTLLRQSYGGRPAAAAAAGGALNSTGAEDGGGASEAGQSAPAGAVNGTGDAAESASEANGTRAAEAAEEGLSGTGGANVSATPASNETQAEASLAAAATGGAAADLSLPRHVHARRKATLTVRDLLRRLGSLRPE